MTHPNKHIREAVEEALKQGWRLVPSGGSAWARLLCPRAGRDGQIITVYSTPRSPEGHAKYISRRMRQCPHRRP